MSSSLPFSLSLSFPRKGENIRAFLSKMPKRRAPILFHRKLGIVTSLHREVLSPELSLRNSRNGIIRRKREFGRMKIFLVAFHRKW